MPYDEDSLLGGLAPQREGMGGLLGSLDSKMPYLAMIAKGLNPYSELDPMALMKLEQAKREHAIAQAFRRQQLDLSRRGQDREDAEFKYKQTEREEARRGDAGLSDIFREAQQPAGVTPLEAGVGASAMEGADTVAQAPAAPRPDLRTKIMDYVQKYPNRSPASTKMLMDLLEKEEAKGSETRKFSERKALAKEMGLEEGTSSWQSYMATGNPGRNQPLGAGDRKEMYASEDELPAIQGTRENLTRALELNPNTYTGFGAGVKGWLGANFPMDTLDPKKVEATTEWRKIMSTEAIKDMARTLKGATTDFELRKFEDILADPSTPIDIRKRTLERMLTLAERQEKVRGDRLDQLRDGTYFKPGGGASAKPTPGDSRAVRQDPLGIR